LASKKHEAAFRASEIDPEVLPELTDADLEKLGVPLKRLLKAISNLASRGQPTPSRAAS
jgi:hypothetical protein